ncbi:ATAD2, partial [Symbiodinium microadriaticum]
MAHADVAAALLQKLESFPVFNIDLSSLLADGAYFSPEQALVSRILEARRAAPCVIYLPDVIGWWRSATDSLRTILMVQLDSIPVNLAVLWVSSLILEPGRSEQQNDTGAASNSACVGNISNDSVKIDSLGMRAEGTCPSEGKDTSVINFDEKLLQVIHFLGGGECNSKMITGDEASYGLLTRSYASVIDLCVPTYIERLDFFSKFFESLSKLPHTLYSAQKTLYKSHNQVLHMAEEVAATTEEGGKGQYGVRSAALALADINEERDKNFMREQRVFFRAALSELLKEKRFQSLWRPVDPEQVPDYYDVITAPMDLETMRSKVDADLYPTYKYFLYDIEQIIFNAKEYNPLNSKDSRGRSIVSAAHNMLDVVETHAYGFKQRMEYD